MIGSGKCGHKKMIQPIKLRLTIVGAKVGMKNLDREFKTAIIKANIETRIR
jgi:hypothetical protein